MGASAFPRRIYTNDSNMAYWDVTDISDGSWTFTDTTAMIKSYSWLPGKGNVIQVNALASSTAAQNVNGAGGGISNCPRWFKPALYDDGTPVLATDAFTVSVYTDMVGPIDNIRYFDWYIGICNSPTNSSIAATKFHGVGTGWNFANTSGDVFGVLMTGATTTAATPLDATDTQCYSSMMHIGGLTNISQISVDPAGNRRSDSVLLNQTTALTGGLYVMIQCGTRGTGRALVDGHQMSFKCHYKISRMITGEL
jgi:hypothetical protein